MSIDAGSRLEVGPTKTGLIQMSKREQELLSRVAALDAALRRSLAELSALYGTDARAKLRTIRDELIRKLEEGAILAERELDHAKIVRPSVEAIEVAFEEFV
jgi:hypothetical protein